MKRIILSLALIVLVGGGIAFGATSAFFNDSETSLANIMNAGDIDLRVDNESYYNGLFNEGTSWQEDDLDGDEGYKFFDFSDLKPGDYGEDTISLHVDTNDAYLCAAVKLTSNDENTCNEPEALEDQTCGVDEVGAGLGELSDRVTFIWWGDDGDNVLEVGEDVISQGELGGLQVGESYPLTLADSKTNIWNVNEVGGPVDGNQTYYIGKAWCFGKMGTAPLPADQGDAGRTPSGDNNDNDVSGEPEDGGLTCDGSLMGNDTQTDSLTADIVFSAVQARHNGAYLCPVPEAGTTLTLVKQVFNSGSFNQLPTDWTLLADGPTDISGISGSGNVTLKAVEPGVYDLSESGPTGYNQANWYCTGGVQNDANTVTIADGQHVTCTVTNYIACTASESYADAVVTFDQGVRKNNTAVTADRIDPTKTLGVQQSGGSPFDNPVVANSFFSLGFDEGTDPTPTEGGWIQLEFTNNYIVDGPGNDIRAWEVTGGTSYPVEKIKIEVSQNGSSWATVTSSADRDTEANLGDSGLTWAKYIRITDVSDRALFEATADGYDLDGVSALTCASVPVQSVRP